TIRAGGWLDFVASGDGNDYLDGRNTGQNIAAADVLAVIYAGAGSDTVIGGNGLDVLIGGDGDDTITGGDFANVIIGDDYTAATPGFALGNIQALSQGKLVNGLGLIPFGTGNDVITGGDGLDIVIAGAGDDRVRGEAGPDKFVFDNPSVEKDPTSFFFFEIGNFLTDFDPATGDTDESNNPNNPAIEPWGNPVQAVPTAPPAGPVSGG